MVLASARQPRSLPIFLQHLRTHDIIRNVDHEHTNRRDQFFQYLFHMVKHVEEMDESGEHELSSLAHIRVPEHDDKFDIVYSLEYNRFEQGIAETVIDRTVYHYAWGVNQIQLISLIPLFNLHITLKYIHCLSLTDSPFGTYPHIIGFLMRNLVAPFTELALPRPKYSMSQAMTRCRAASLRVRKHHGNVGDALGLYVDH